MLIILIITQWLVCFKKGRSIFSYSDSFMLLSKMPHPNSHSSSLVLLILRFILVNYLISYLFICNKLPSPHLFCSWIWNLDSLTRMVHQWGNLTESWVIHCQTDPLMWQLSRCWLLGGNSARAISQRACFSPHSLSISCLGLDLGCLRQTVPRKQDEVHDIFIIYLWKLECHSAIPYALG